MKKMYGMKWILVSVMVFSSVSLLEARTNNPDGLQIEKKEGKYILGIPGSLLGRDILILSRIVKGPTDRAGTPVYFGDPAGERWIRFDLTPANKIVIRKMTFQNRSNDSTSNGMHTSLLRSSEYAIIASFELLGSEKGMHLIDFTGMLEGDNDMLYFDAYKRSLLNPGSFDAANSFIDEVMTVANSLQVKATRTYRSGADFSTYKIISTFVIPGSEPMRTRLQNDRIGYLSRTWNDFDLDPHRVKPVNVILRWRLEPRPEDVARYKSGIAVVPKRPITFYIDPAIPHRWTSYVVNGVKAWNDAFLQAGFKDAIVVKEVRTVEDRERWNSEIPGIGRVIWHPSLMDNAQGLTISDPRTGEIISATVRFYHNEMKWNFENYLLLAAATDERAKQAHFSDQLMGQIIESVITHEVGHTLGLPHNFISSSMVSVEQVRNKKWVEENGFCPSIMEYARYNFVAQPEDNIGLPGLIRRLGVYDRWAIEWGYKWLPVFNSHEEEQKYMDKWISSRIGSDRRLYYHFSEGMAEDLGNDVIEANRLGIKNLKRVAATIKSWGSDTMTGIDMEDLHKKLVGQWVRYLDHAADLVVASNNISLKGSTGFALVPANKKEKKDAIRFLHDELFTTPAWLMEKFIHQNMESGQQGIYLVLFRQEELIKRLLSATRLKDYLIGETILQDDAYTVCEILEDLRSGIFSELSGIAPVDVYRRNLQKVYVSNIVSTFNAVKNDPLLMNTDLPVILKQHIRSLTALIAKAIPRYNDEMIKGHLENLSSQLEKGL